MAKKSGTEVTISSVTDIVVPGGAVTLTGPVCIQLSTVMLELPVGKAIPGAFRFRHVDLQLDDHQSEALRILYDGLVASVLANGRRIASSSDVIRFLLEQLYGCYNAVGATDESKVAIGSNGNV